MFYFTCDRSFIYCIYCTEYGASKPRVRGAIANHDDDDDDDELEYQAHLGPTACDNSPTTSRYCEHSSHLIGHQWPRKINRCIYRRNIARGKTGNEIPNFRRTPLNGRKRAMTNGLPGADIITAAVVVASDGRQQLSARFYRFTERRRFTPPARIKRFAERFGPLPGHRIIAGRRRHAPVRTPITGEASTELGYDGWRGRSRWYAVCLPPPP